MKLNKFAPFILGMVFAAPAFSQVNPAVAAAPVNVVAAPVSAIATPLASETLVLRSQGALIQNEYLNKINELLILADAEGMQRDWFVDDQVAATLNYQAQTGNKNELRKTAYNVVYKMMIALNRGYIQPEKLGDKTLVSLDKIKGSAKGLPALIQKELFRFEKGEITGEQLFATFRPKNASYTRLLELYRRVTTAYKKGEISDADVPVNKTVIKRGSKDEISIKFARKRLALFGYKKKVQIDPASTFTAEAQEINDYNRFINDPNYTDELQIAIEELQENNLLGRDGVIGKDSYGLLTTPIEQIITRLKLNLDRSRWLPDNLTSEYVHVNLAAQRFFYYKNNQIALTFKTINGAKERPTPILTSKITTMILNPTWTVAPTPYFKDKTKMFSSWNGLNDVNEKRYTFIVENMKIIADYNARHMAMTGQEYPFMDVMRRFTNPLDNTITATQENWPAFMKLFQDEKARFELVPGQRPDKVTRALRIVQRPGGEQNALGWIKFPLNGTNSIYMHDTNQRELFANRDRLLSSGCVRMEKPWELAIMLLGATHDPLTDEYSGATIDPVTNMPYTIQSLHDRTLNRMPIADRPDPNLDLGRSVPVYFLYDTAHINDVGQLTLVKDNYGVDLDMYKLMMGIPLVSLTAGPAGE
ncbi:MAG: L,D-transpeptidase family protein [Pseudobdellovibrio sp.]|nr:L,D-transpeptidase family protein [Pseudobdellovibrio sp.]